MANQDKSSGKKWQKVIQFLAAYLVAAWTFLQFVDWTLIRYDISPYWVDMLLWIFIGIIPSLTIYLYHKERINKKILKLREKIIFPLNAILISVVLFFGFGNSDLGSTTKKVTFKNDIGQVQTQTITKEEFRIGVPIFNFQQEKKDSTTQWLGNTINRLIELDLNQDKNISPESSYAENTNAKVKSSAVFNEFYVDGFYAVEDGMYSITPIVHASKNGKEISRKKFTGPDFFKLIDDISIYIKDNVGIVEEMRDRYIDLDVKEMTTGSMEALKLWSNRNYDEAVKVDNNFTLAYFDNAVRRNRYSQGELEEKDLIDKAYNLKNNLPTQSQFEILMYKHIIYNRWADAEELINYQLEIEPNNETYNRLLYMVYSETKNIEGFYNHAKKRFNANRNEETARNYYVALMLNEKYDDAISLVKAFELLAPNIEDVQRIKAFTYLGSNKLEEAKKVYKKINLTWPKESIHQDKVEEYFKLKKEDVEGFDYKSSLGTYRSEMSEQQVEYFKKNNTYYIHYQNQLLNLGLDFDKNSLLSLDPSWVSGTHHFFQKDSLNNVYRVKADQFNRKRQTSFYYYKETEEIREAYKQLQLGNYEGLATTFESLIQKYPKHWFLKDALKHINYNEKKGAKIFDEFEKYAGNYSNRKFWVEDKKLFYKRDNLTRVQIYPISDSRYISLSKFGTHYGFEKTKDNKEASFSWTYDFDKEDWVKAEENTTNYLLKN